jgi:hypothetical protein
MQTRSPKTATRPQRPAAKAKPDDIEQSRTFIEKAREIGADEKHSAADKLMKRLAETKPEPRAKKPPHD